ncbi:MAG TPA: hypothetical protein VK250_11305 [Nitrososphaeraceae archaeon]|nr:hypothetical protein [Nitrososphaeraceae archaeon]
MIHDSQNRTTSDDDDDDDEDDVEILCKHCQHKISLHNPKCSFVLEEQDNENEEKEEEEKEEQKIGNEDLTQDMETRKRKCCDCEKPEFYNAVISGKYFGWIEIHCNNCGKLLCYLDSSTENVYDFEILCKKCIVKKH